MDRIIFVYDADQKLLHTGPDFDLNGFSAQDGVRIRTRTYEKQADGSYKISDNPLRRSGNAWKSEYAGGARVSFILSAEIEKLRSL